MKRLRPQGKSESFGRLHGRNCSRMINIALLPNEISTKKKKLTNISPKISPKFGPMFLMLCNVGRRKSLPPSNFSYIHIAPLQGHLADSFLEFHILKSHHVSGCHCSFFYAAPIGAFFCPEIRAFTGFWGEISSTASKVLSDLQYNSNTKMAVSSR